MANIFVWILIVVCLIVTLDKTITAINIKQVEKNFPDIDPLIIEKNPVAKWFFVNLGLFWGTVMYWIISVIIVLITLTLLALCLKLFNVSNYLSISLYVIMIIYGFVIFNNLYFFLKYSQLIP